MSGRGAVSRLRGCLVGGFGRGGLDVLRRLALIVPAKEIWIPIILSCFCELQSVSPHAMFDSGTLQLGDATSTPERGRDAPRSKTHAGLLILAAMLVACLSATVAAAQGAAPNDAAIIAAPDRSDADRQIDIRPAPVARPGRSGAGEPARLAWRRPGCRRAGHSEEFMPYAPAAAGRNGAGGRAGRRNPSRSLFLHAIR
jgi:hypothetical protein